MGRSYVKGSLVVGLSLAVLASCAIPDGARSGLRALAKSEGAVVFSGAPFGQAADPRIVYANSIEREEYALFKSPDRQAELVYITTRHIHITNVVIDKLFSLDETISGFRFNQMQPVVSGTPFKLKAKGIGFWAKSYQLAKANQTCGAFSGSWDAPGDELRPSKVLFGYFCETGQLPLTKAQIKSTVDKIGIRGITADAGDGIVSVPRLSESPTQPVLRAQAQGQPGERQGNSRFPYNVVRFYKQDESCRFLPNC